jgi:hypothetical protein
MGVEEYLELCKEFEELDPSIYYDEDGKLDVAKFIRNKPHFVKEFTVEYGRLTDVKFYKPDMRGFIYLIRAENGYVKIGITRNIDNRLKTLETASPLQLELLKSKHVRNAPAIDRRLHKLYQDKRKRFEWFDLDDQEIKEIITLINQEI